MGSANAFKHQNACLFAGLGSVQELVFMSRCVNLTSDRIVDVVDSVAQRRGTGGACYELWRRLGFECCRGQEPNDILEM